MNTFDDDEEEQVVVREEDDEIDDIIGFNILTKVPSTESLFVSLRYVCKPWFNFITNSPLFHQSLPINSELPGLIIQTEDNASWRYLKSLSEEEHDRLNSSREPVTYTTHFFKFGKERNELVEQAVVDLSSCFKYTRIIHCFQGLIVATNSSRKNVHEEVYVVNPVTKQRLKLPLRFGGYCNDTGVVFVPSTREYKVLQIIRRQHYARFYLRIVTLRTGTGDYVDDGNLQLKLIKVPKYVHIWEVYRDTNFTFAGRPLAVNGILYLTPTIDESKYPMKYIVCFDAGEEKFYKIAHPDFNPHFNKFRERRWYIDIGGSLAYMRFDTSLRPLRDQLDIYILKEDPDYKHREWINQHSISLAPSILRHESRDNHIADDPVCALRDGEVIIFASNYYDEGRYRAYDVKLNKWWELGIKLEPGRKCFEDIHVQRSRPVLSSLF